MAKAFRFPLDELLKLRRLKEDVARRDFAAARAAVQDQNLALLRLAAEQDEGKAAARALKLKALDLVRMRMTEQYLNALDRRLRREFAKLQDLVRVEIEKRRALAEAARGVKVLDRLRERQMKDYMYELSRQEQKFLDEVNQQIGRTA